jgi:hypothetical protein
MSISASSHNLRSGLAGATELLPPYAQRVRARLHEPGWAEWYFPTVAHISMAQSRHCTARFARGGRRDEAMWFRSRFLSAQTGFAVGIAATAVEHTSDVFETAFQQASPRFDRERNVVSIGRQTDRLL